MREMHDIMRKHGVLLTKCFFATVPIFAHLATFPLLSSSPLQKKTQTNLRFSANEMNISFLEQSLFKQLLMGYSISRSILMTFLLCILIQTLETAGQAFQYCLCYDNMHLHFCYLCSYKWAYTNILHTTWILDLNTALCFLWVCEATPGKSVSYSMEGMQFMDQILLTLHV